MENKELKLSSPWATYFSELEALFGEDPEIRLEADWDKTYVIKMYVDNQEKAEAIARLLPMEKTFGNVIVHIVIIPANKNLVSKTDIYSAAFKGNPAFVGIENHEESTEAWVPPFAYVIFKSKVVQFFNDELNDYHGMHSTLYQDIARDVFGEQKGVFFCTESPDAE